MFGMGNITTTANEWTAQKIVIYGVPGIGKTVFASTFENAFILRTEAGTEAVNIPTFPDQYGRPMLFDNYDAFVSALYSFMNEQHNFSTLIIDSADWLESLIHAKVCEELKVSDIDKVGYGKGFTAAEAKWKQLLKDLEDLLRFRGVNIIMIAHSDARTHTPPGEAPYDRYQIKLHKKSQALLQEWAGMILFANYRRSIRKEEQGFNKTHNITVGSGDRVLYTQETNGAFVAKNRVSLPDEIHIGQDRTWSAFHYELNKATGGKYPLPSYLNNQF